MRDGMSAVNKFISTNLGRTSVKCRVGWSLAVQCSLVKPDTWHFWRRNSSNEKCQCAISRKVHVHIYDLTYLLTPWSRVLLEKLTGLQLVKKFPAFYGTRRFITALTSVRHRSLSWANPIQSTYPHPTSWRSILILSTHLRLGLPSGLFLPPVSPPRPYTPPTTL